MTRNQLRKIYVENAKVYDLTIEDSSEHIRDYRGCIDRNEDPADYIRVVRGVKLA